MDVAEKKDEQAVLDDSTVHEPESNVPRTSPQGSPSPSSASQLFAPHYAGNIQHVMEVDEVDDEMWKQEIAEYVELQWVSLDGEEQDGEQMDEGKPPEVSQKSSQLLMKQLGLKRSHAFQTWE